ncbi:MAG TPA: cytochrome D1 domain-containing protein [Terriglobales bacterium]
MSFGSCFGIAVLLATATASAQHVAAGARYVSPGELAISADGGRLYVVCEKSDELRVVDTHTQKLIARIPVGRVPRGVSVSSDSKQVFVANSWDDSVSVVDAQTFEVVSTLRTGFEPISVVADQVALDRAGRNIRVTQTLYVANRLSNDISVVDLAGGKEIKRLAAGRGASYLALSPDGRRVYATHIYPAIGAQRTPPQSEITVIDTATRRVVERVPLHNIAGVFHVALSSDGKLGVAAHLCPKNLIPLAHVEHGWAFTDSLALFGEEVGGVVDIPLDELERYFAMPYGVAIAPDKSKVFVSSAGSDVVIVIDVAALLKFTRASRHSFVNDLSASANYVAAHIPVGHNPRGIVLSPDGKLLYVAERMDDNIAVIDTRAERVIDSIDLGGPKTVTPLRNGEQLFNSARFAFQGQFSCANCHIDSTLDGLQWDLEPDGFGVDIVDNRNIEGLMGTQPFKWNGGNPDLPTECGPRTERYFYRSQSYDSKQLTDLVSYVLSLPARPNRYHAADGELTASQERGKAIFDRIKYKDGRIIPENERCPGCHTGPKYTVNKSFDVGTGKKTDRSPLVDTPHLPNIAYSAPYLHDGSARSLEEIWTVFNPKDTHGATNDLTKDELNDLIEYLRTL